MRTTFKTSCVSALALVGLLAAAGCGQAPSNAAGSSTAATAADASNAAGATNTAAATPTAGGSDAADAKAFLDGLYAHYKSSKNNNFQPFDGNAKEVLDDDTIALFKADKRALGNEGVGAIDSDWVCDCQDYNSIVATVTVQSATPTEATAIADFHDPEDTTDKPGHDTFDLVKTAAGWRIHDMGTRDQPSLRKVLQDEIAHPPKG